MFCFPEGPFSFMNTQNPYYWCFHWAGILESLRCLGASTFCSSFSNLLFHFSFSTSTTAWNVANAMTNINLDSECVSLMKLPYNRGYKKKNFRKELERKGEREITMLILCQIVHQLTLISCSSQARWAKPLKCPVSCSTQKFPSLLQRQGFFLWGSFYLFSKSREKKTCLGFTSTG